MPRKSARENGGFRRTGWKAKLAKHEAEEKRIVKNIYIGASNAKRWIILKKKLEYRSDVDFVAYLLNLAEPFSGKGKLERKDQDDCDGKKIPIPKVPDISVDEEDNPERSQRSRGEEGDCNGLEDGAAGVGSEVIKGGAGEVTDGVEGGVGEEESGRRGVRVENGCSKGGVEEERVGQEEGEEEEEDDEEDEDEEEDEEESVGEWVGSRQPLRRSLRSIPTNRGAKMSVRRSARNVHRGEEGEEGGEGDEEGEAEGGEEEDEEATVSTKRRKRGERSERRQRRRERKKHRKRKRLEGSGGGEGAEEGGEEEEEDEEGEEEEEEEDEGEGVEESEGEAEGERVREASTVVGASSAVEKNFVSEASGAIAPEAPRKGRRGRKKKVVTLEVAVAVGEATAEGVALEGGVEKKGGEEESGGGVGEVPHCQSADVNPLEATGEEVSREADASTAHVTEGLEEPAIAVIDAESDRVSKHHRHHKRKSRKSRDSLEDEGDGGEDAGGEGAGEEGEGWEGSEGRRRRKRKRGRGRRGAEECGVGEFEGGQEEGEEGFPRYKVVEGILVDGEALDKGQAVTTAGGTVGAGGQPGREGGGGRGVEEEEEEGVLIEVGERVKLKRRRKRRHSRGGEDGEGDAEGANANDTQCDEHVGVLRRAAKHKKRKHGHGEGHGNRRKHHDVRKVPVDGVLPEIPANPSSTPQHLDGLSTEMSGGSPHDPLSNPTAAHLSVSALQPSSLPAPPAAVTTALDKTPSDAKQRVAIRITLCGECDSRHVLDACPLKRPLTIIHDTVVLREMVTDDQTKDEEQGADGVPLGDNESKSFATEEEETKEAQDRQESQDLICKKKKKKPPGDDEDALMPAGGKEQDERRRRRNGFSEALEDRLAVPNGKYQPGGAERGPLLVMAARDEVKQVNGDNGDGSIIDSKGGKDESGMEEGNKLDSHEEDIVANGNSSLAPNSTLTSKPSNEDETESANETLVSQPSPMPMPDPITPADAPVGGSNNGNTGKTFAEASLPMALKLETREASHGPGVTAKRPIARFTQFGPLLGRKIREMDIPDDFGMRHIWEVMGASGRFLLSTEDPTTSNWLRFIRPAPTREQRNVAPVTRGDRLYFVTTAPLQVGEELLYWPDESSSLNALAASGAQAGATPNSSSNPSSGSSSSSTSSSSSGTGWAKKKMEKTNCGGCNLRFGHPLYYRLHCSVFHDPNFSLTIRKYHCKVCGASVLGKENIMRHAAENHDGKGAYQCQFCKKFFLRLNYLEMHRTYGCAANPQRTRPLCDFCGRKFCQPQKLKVHIKRMHSDMADVLREFQCKLCLKLLGSRAALQRHMKEVHHRDVVGACACDRCGKTFQNKSNLKIHMLTHSGVKPFRCAEDSCPAAFTTKQCLQFHYKKVHGYGEESMPSIERCVAYTFDAYSGGTVEDPGRGKVPLFTSSHEKDADDLDSSNPSNQAPDSEVGDDEVIGGSVGGVDGRSPQQRSRKEQQSTTGGEAVRRERGAVGGGRGRGRRPGRPSGGRAVGVSPNATPTAPIAAPAPIVAVVPEEEGGMGNMKDILEGGDALVVVDSLVPSAVIPEDILPPPPDAEVLPPPPPVIPSLPDGSSEGKEAMLGNIVDSQPPPLTPQPGPLPTEVAPQTPTLEAYNGGQSVLGAPPPIGAYTDHSRVSYPGKVVSKGSKKWMGDGSVPMRPTSEAEMEEEEEEEDEEEDDEEELEEDDGVNKRDDGVVPADGQVVTDVYGAFPEDNRFVAEDAEEGFRRPEESNASLLVEAALDAAERDMTGVAVAEDEGKSHHEAEGGYMTSSPRANGPERHMDENDHRGVLHHPQPSHHPHSHLQQHHSHTHPHSHHTSHLQHHSHHLPLHHHQLAHTHVHLPPPPASHLHVQGGALMLHHSHHPTHHHPTHHHSVTHHQVMHQEEDDDEERLGPGSEATSVGTIVERIVNTSLAEDDDGEGRDEVPHPNIRTMHLLHPDSYVPEPHGRLPPAGSLPSPRNMTLLGMKAAVKVEEELQHMAAMQQRNEEEEEEEEGLDMSYKHGGGGGHYGRATVSGMTHHMQDEEEDGTQAVGGVGGDPSAAGTADDLQDFRVLRSPQVEGRFEQTGLDMSRGSFPFALPSARCFPLYEGSGSAADVARSVDLRRAGLAYTSPPLPPYSQSLDLTPMRTRHSVDLSLPRSLVGSEGVGPQQGGGGQSPPPPPSPMHRHLCHAPPLSPHHHVHHHHGAVDNLGCVVGSGDDGGEGGSGGGLSPPPPGSYQSGSYLHGPPSYHRQVPQHPPSPPPSPYHPQARTVPHMPPPAPAASPSPYHHYSGYY